MKRILGNGTLVTLGEDARVIHGGAFLADGSVIAEVGDTEALRGANPDAEYIDAGGGLIMPGLINAHMHLYSTFACGIALKDAPPANFEQILERLWWRLDKALTMEDVELSALVPLVRCLRAGTTTIIDHHASPGAVRGSLDAIARRCKEVGVRACLCYELSDRDGPETATAGIDENVAFARRCTEETDDMLAALFGLHASLTVGAETLERAVDAARGVDGLGFHVHAAEDRIDPEHALANFGKRVVERFHDAGVLGEHSLLAHCIHIDEKEKELLLDSGTMVAHNAQSNMNNAVGCADVLDLYRRGVLIGLGSDGMTSNMLDELRAAHLLHKHVQADPRVAFLEACGMLLEKNAEIATRIFGRPLGVIRPGAFADAVVFDYLPPTPLTAENFLGHLVFGLPSAHVAKTMVGGEVVFADGRPTRVDEAEVAARAREHAQALWERF